MRKLKFSITIAVIIIALTGLAFTGIKKSPKRTLDPMWFPYDGTPTTAAQAKTAANYLEPVEEQPCTADAHFCGIFATPQTGDPDFPDISGDASLQSAIDLYFDPLSPQDDVRIAEHD